jgi:Golgi SNAP receptor complex protein 2
MTPSQARQRFAQQQASSSQVSESPFNLAPQPTIGLREDHVLREHTFLQNTEEQLDGFLAQGKAVLDNLLDQRGVLKGTQRRLLDAANTLGLSRDVIGWIERRR